MAPPAHAADDDAVHQIENRKNMHVCALRSALRAIILLLVRFVDRAVLRTAAKQEM